MEFPVEKLIRAAEEARERAYAPYSNYRVGAAILTRQGRCYTGCNIENASYGLTCCAERVALYKAVSAGEHDFDAIAVTAATDDFCVPCGACRQTLAEFSRNLKVYMVNARGDYLVKTLDELLPCVFDRKRLLSGTGGDG
ncbi:MAG TPA: cytidine deaminase [Bacillota bacterium]|jgi:cytidine deaminase|nr:cytidine deaminase [Peptococcaceae bacterium MAG4]NLW37374.1 cytidine deaminase [Peptococcaceae bacterium]HPU35287.1 cytidine deaminase [Bacillota bacterium]HPZ43857.1 cytidine deaminase [Bacillota bacterium]HQD76358.1 cytidine deaminase [Bacillota bacterium]